MAQQERAIRTRQAILRAAAAVFDEYGYEAATIAEILARAEVTKGALYFHFDSKEKLARGVLAAQVPQGAVLPQPFKLQELVDVTMAVAHRLPGDPLLRGGVRLAVEQAGQGALGDGPFADWVELCTGLLVEAKAQGEVLPHVEPAATAELVVGAWTGIQLLSQALTRRADLERRIAAFWAQVLPGIAVPGVLPHLAITEHRGAEVVTAYERATTVRLV
ncbi:MULTISPECIES: ScbR family autoregulator-binding transcription factor [Kitasatospora]|uniref:AcrR family transcriptional regulator n=2 Tax=Kitasatospora TaxID=2063 RepID=A0ABT1J091_9ACTN|nr:ScbR family autoregulator-binding transcription factor [Kitasatospora paracochleata]MCP2310211.1 AcrR family transcriptional regulator [Kitasatospora paracochleata]